MYGWYSDIWICFNCVVTMVQILCKSSVQFTYIQVQFTFINQATCICMLNLPLYIRSKVYKFVKLLKHKKNIGLYFNLGRNTGT